MTPVETPTPVYLTVDLFFRPGEASTDWALWVCLQPHVRRAQLAGWVEESGGRESAYQLVPRPVQGVEREDFVPVCFRDGDDVSLALSSLDGTVSIERGNAGRHDLIVADGEAIAVRNPDPAASDRRLLRQGLHPGAAPGAGGLRR